MIFKNVKKFDKNKKREPLKFSCTMTLHIFQSEQAHNIIIIIIIVVVVVVVVVRTCLRFIIFFSSIDPSF